MVSGIGTTGRPLRPHALWGKTMRGQIFALLTANEGCQAYENIHNSQSSSLIQLQLPGKFSFDRHSAMVDLAKWIYEYARSGKISQALIEARICRPESWTEASVPLSTRQSYHPHRP